MNQDFDNRLEKTVLDPLRHTSRVYKLVMLALFGVVAWGLFAFTIQLRDGLAVTGMRDYVFWGLYISNFVFFIGISHAGTLISAILRVSKAGWRTPVTRMAEFITVVALSVGALFPMIDLGRPDRIAGLFQYGRWQSPIVWDILAISTYLTGSAIYLFLPLIEDLAICRDKLGPNVPTFKRLFYKYGSLGWTGTPKQKKYLATAMSIMAILIIPIAVSVHTVVSFIFAMQLRAGWNSTVFGVFFVAGAIYSGIATIIIVMAVLRRAFHLEEYITKKHFLYLGYLLGAFVLIMAYFNWLEFLVPGYKMDPAEKFLIQDLLTGTYAPAYWGYLLIGLLVPGLIILIPRTRTVAWIVFAAILVNISMWVERFLIVVPPLRVPQMPHEVASYFPSWVEFSIIAGAIAGFAFVIGAFAKLFPVISIWEVKEHHQENEHVVEAAPAQQAVER